jgi:hypothetical protein
VRVNLQIDTDDVPEDKRDAKFQEELIQFQISLRRDALSQRWLFRLALHEGAHWRYKRKSGEECTPRGPHMVYRDGELQCINGSISSRPEKLRTFDFTVGTLKEWLAGPLAVTVLTGEPADPEPDILAACKYLEISRDKIGLWLCLVEPDLKEGFQNPIVAGEILDAAREYARAIFHNDFCIEWGIKRYRLPSSSCKAAQEACSGGNPSPTLRATKF